MKSKTESKSAKQLLDNAVAKHVDNEYEDALLDYFKALDLLKKTNHQLQTIYCKTGILQCQFMLGIIPKRLLCALASNLTTAITQLSQSDLNSREAKECLDGLNKIVSRFANSKKRTEYQYVVAVNIHAAIVEPAKLDKLCKLIEIKSHNVLFVHFLINAKIDLQEALDVHQKAKSQTSQDKAKAVNEMIALISEDIADTCMNIVENHRDSINQQQYEFCSQQAKSHYLHAINTWKTLDVPPGLELLFSPLYAASKLGEIESQQEKACDFMNDYIAQYQLESIISKIDDAELKQKYTHELQTYTDSIATQIKANLLLNLNRISTLASAAPNTLFANRTNFPSPQKRVADNSPDEPSAKRPRLSEVSAVGIALIALKTGDYISVDNLFTLNNLTAEEMNPSSENQNNFGK